MSNYINEVYLLPSSLPKSILPFIKEIENADKEEDYGKYCELTDTLISSIAKNARVSKKDMEILEMRYLYDKD